MALYIWRRGGEFSGQKERGLIVAAVEKWLKRGPWRARNICPFGLYDLDSSLYKRRCHICDEIFECEPLRLGILCPCKRHGPGRTVEIVERLVREGRVAADGC